MFHLWNCGLKWAKQDFPENGRITMTEQVIKSKVLQKVGCLPYEVGKQLSITLINIGRKWTFYDDNEMN